MTYAEMDEMKARHPNSFRVLVDRFMDMEKGDLVTYILRAAPKVDVMEMMFIVSCEIAQERAAEEREQAK